MILGYRQKQDEIEREIEKMKEASND